jgi:hypothetical protein
MVDNENITDREASELNFMYVDRAFWVLQTRKKVREKPTRSRKKPQTKEYRVYCIWTSLAFVYS